MNAHKTRKPATGWHGMIVVNNVCKTNKWSWHRSCLPVETFTDDNKNDDDDEHSKVTSSKIKRRTKARIIRSVWFNKEAEPEKDYENLNALYTKEKRRNWLTWNVLLLSRTIHAVI